MSPDPGYGDDAAMAHDDLAQISGIGTKTAERLYAAGIRTYADLGSRPADDIVRAVRGVAHPSPAQLDSWRDRARELAAGVSAAPAQAVSESPADGQREESFMVGILVNEDGSIRRMTAQHVGKGKGAKGRWAGLERDALFSFIETAISAPAAEAKTPVEQPSDQVHQAEAARAAVLPPQLESQPLAAPAATIAAAPAATIAARPARLESSATVSVERTPLRAAEPFTMTITIDLADPASHTDRLAYRAVVVAKPLTGGPRRTVAQSEGLIATTASTISIDAAGLPQGAYRLDGAVSLREPGSDRPADLAALAEGLLVEVLPR